MSVSQIASYKPAKALVALAVAGLFVSTPAMAKTAKVKKTPATTSATNVAVAVPQGVKLTDILVQGLQRSDPSAVFGFLPVKVGDTFNPSQSQDVIKALYASGLYEDVSVGLNGSVLVVKLAERPVVADFTIKGMKNFDKKEVSQNLKNYGFAQGYPYDPALLEKVKTELQAMYADAGLVNAKVTSEVKEQDRKQVAITINVDEGQYLKIKKITVEGNKAISTGKIRSIMELNKNGLFSWYSKDSRFAPERFKADLDAIRSYYYDKGYLDFEFTNVETPETADKKGIEIKMAVSEGEPYYVNSIALRGDTRGVPVEEVEKFVKYKQSAVYSRSKMSDIVANVSRRLGDDGYALAKVDIVPSINKSTHLVDVVVKVEPGERVYVRHINVLGNSRTKDEVIRREARQMESSLYSAERVQLSRDRIDRLGYFSEATVETVPVQGANNQVDVNYSVKEVPTGDLKLGLGYSTSDKVSLSGSINENNFMGSGNSLGLEVDTSSSSRNATITTRNPYMTKFGVSRDFSIYYRKYDASKLNISDVKYTTMGVNLSFGVPISERHKIFLGINPERNKVVLASTGSVPPSYEQYTQGGDTFTTYALTAGWSYDTRDSGFAPSRGMLQRLNAEVSPFGDVHYYKASYQLQKFVPISKYLTLAFNSQFDYGKGYGGQSFPFFKNLFAGGIGSIRGFDSSSMGPTQTTQTGELAYIGGSKRVIANLELQFPFPGMTKNRGVRLFTFADLGGLWSDNGADGNPILDSDNCNVSKISFSGCNGLRYSYGVGLSWASPIGPLKFSYGIPINKKPHDKEQRFQFQIGTSF
ncbi:outer membrane protein assembly factor BamA [Hydromonas duriensis]|uniref:Outer membrane protein assembly factor BamA n=1 Tax=Hydromonas duriensis TaxID=1527608 RepID=A0A4R6Y8G6_9BURK|nr:outer membrane protein assembly factor BamA [Hydromonas duriensis]TDR31682.1 Beta-barrel assembly machine subunit BamA [Hydromonas duriensis]